MDIITVSVDILYSFIFFIFYFIQDELDDTVIAMLAQVGTTDLSGNVVRNPDSIRLQQPPVGAVGRGKPDRLLVEQRRPASADPQKYVQKVQNMEMKIF